MTDGVFTQALRLRNRDVDMYRRLRTSRLFELLQEASIAHTEALGMGRTMTLDRGLLWVVTLQNVTIKRTPEYDEAVRVLTWPGETMHVMFPRYYRLETDGGEELVSASAIWMLVDEKTRRFVFPDRYGVEIRGVTTGLEHPMPAAPVPLPFAAETAFTVPYSYVDLNGHMNNTRYLDLAEDVTGAAAAGKRLLGVKTEFKSEIRLGEKLALRWGESGGRIYLAGENGRAAFAVSLQYGD